MRRWDASAVEVPLVHATSDMAAQALPITLAYFIFNMALIPVCGGDDHGAWRRDKWASIGDFGGEIDLCDAR